MSLAQYIAELMDKYSWGELKKIDKAIEKNKKAKNKLIIRIRGER